MPDRCLSYGESRVLQFVFVRAVCCWGCISAEMEECGGKEGGDHKVGGYGLRRDSGNRVRGLSRVLLHASGQAVPMCGVLCPRHHAVFPVQGRSVLVGCFRNSCLILVCGD